MHRIRALRAVKVRHRKLQEEISRGRGVENGSLQEGGEIAQGSVSHLEPLSFSGEPIEHLAPLGIDVLLEAQYVLASVEHRRDFSAGGTA